MKQVREFLLWLIGAAVLTLSLVAIASAREVSYQAAYDAYQLGQPMVVICSASWCPACHALINELKSSDVAFTVLDIDCPPSPEIKAANFTGGSIPQTVVWIPEHQATVPMHQTRGTGNIHAAGVRALLQGK